VRCELGRVDEEGENCEGVLSQRAPDCGKREVSMMFGRSLRVRASVLLDR
jgi:hypothetical protein